MSSFSIIFCIPKFSKIAENWVEDAIIFSVKKKTCTEFSRYEKLALYKFFFYKFSIKCTEPIFDSVKI